MMEDKGDPWLWEGAKLFQELANILDAQTKPLGPTGPNKLMHIASEILNGEDLCKGPDLVPSFYDTLSGLIGVEKPLLAQAINALREKSAQYQHWRNELFRQNGNHTAQADPADALKSHSLKQLPQLDAVQAEQPNVTLRDVGHEEEEEKRDLCWVTDTIACNLLGIVCCGSYKES